MVSRVADEPVRLGVIVGLVVVSDTADNDRPNGPEHLYHLGRWSPQSHWHDFGTVGRRIGDENTPGDAFQDLSGEKHAIAVAEVEDENEGVQSHEATNGCPSISNRTGNGTGDEYTNESTDRSAALKC